MFAFTEFSKNNQIVLPQSLIIYLCYITMVEIRKWGHVHHDHFEY